MATDPQYISSTTQTNIPTYAQPFYEEIMRQAAKQTYTTDAGGAVTGVRPYVPYTAERVAGFTPQQLAVQQATAGLTTPTQFAQAGQQLQGVSGIAGLAAPTGLQQAFGYTPTTVGSQQIGGISGISAPSVGTPQQVGAQQIGAATIGAPTSITTGQFTAPGTAAAYMSPYQQQVTDIATREAQRQAQIQRASQAMGAIGRGTFGGGRQALIQGETDRATQQLLADIQAKGGQAAFEQAQQAFQADQARALQAQQANVQYGLQAAQANQATQMQSQIQNQQTSLDAAKSNQQALLQAGQYDQAAQLQAQIQNQQTNLDRLKANQAAALQATQYTQQGQQFAAGLGKDIGLAGLTTGLEAAKTTGQLGATQQIADLERLKSQAASAAEQRAYQQEIDNIKYQTFREAQDYQRKLLEYQSNLLQGTAGALGQTEVQYAPPPSTASQIAGLGLAGLGLYNIMGSQTK